MALHLLWDEFRSSFVKNLEALPVSQFNEAWKTSKNRTRLYEHTILEPVCREIGLNYKKELFKIDYTFCRKSKNGTDVPLVFIESENVALDAEHEMRKLCCLSAPLKVLITCAEWSDIPGDWKNGGYKELLTNRWSEMISAHNSIWPQPALTGVLIAEALNERLRYYSILFGPNGSIEKESEIIFEIKLR